MILMLTLALSALLAVVGPIAQTSPSTSGANPAASPTASQAPEDLKITARVKTEFAAWQRGSIDRSAYTQAANERLNNDTVDAISGQLKELGAIRSTSSLSSYKQADSTVYVYVVRCEKGNVRMKLGFDSAGKISAVSFLPEE